MYHAWRTSDLWVTMGQHWRIPCMSPLYITIVLILQNVSSNIFIQPRSQFQVLESVPNVIWQVGSSANQHDTSRIADGCCIEDTHDATDAPNMDLTAQVVEIDNLHLTTSGMASTSTSTLAEVSQTSDPIPTPQHATISTGPSPSGPTASGFMPTTPNINAIFNKRYQHKARMEPRVAIMTR